MPRPFTKFHVGLDGYTAHVVVKALEAIGLPGAIKATPDKECHGPLVVTLMSELASVLALLLQKNVAGRRFAQDKEEFIEFKGGTSFRHLCLQLKEVEIELHSIRAEILALHDRNGNYVTKKSVEFDQQKETAIQLEQVVKWKGRNKVPGVMLGKISEEKNKLSILMVRFEETGNEFLKIQSQVREQRDKISNAPQFKKKLKSFLLEINPEAETYPQNRIGLDLLENDPHLEKGVTLYLRNTDANWWAKFAHFVAQEVGNDSVVPSHIIFRDGWFNEALAGPKKHEPSNSERKTFLERSEILAKSQKKHSSADESVKFLEGKADRKNASIRLYYSRWPKVIRSKTSVIKDWDILRFQDERVVRWIETHGGLDHPFNIYSADLVSERLKRIVEITDIPNYSRQVAKNELLHCLSQRGQNRYPFEGHFDEKFSQQDWEKHTAGWKKSGFQYYKKLTENSKDS